MAYTNTSYGFTIKYPSDWNVDDSNITGMGVVFGKKPEGDVQVSRVRDPNVTASLEHEIKHMLLPGIEAHGFRLTELNTNTYFLSGYPAIRVIGIQHYPKADVKIMITFIKSGANVYSVKYLSHLETYLTYLPIAQQMTDSFQVINARCASTILACALTTDKAVLPAASSWELSPLLLEPIITEV